VLVSLSRRNADSLTRKDLEAHAQRFRKPG